MKFIVAWGGKENNFSEKKTFVIIIYIHRGGTAKKNVLILF